MILHNERTGDILKPITPLRITFLIILGILILFAVLQFSPLGKVKGIPVLNYHEVQNNDNNPLSLSVPEFDQQMSYLHRHGFHAITPDQLYAYLHDGSELPAKPVLITFDDGYRNTYTNAYPILEKYGYTATVFLITDFVGNNAWYLDWHQIKEMQHNGIIFGSHTLNHIPLVELSPKKALFELEKSKAGIEWRLGVPVKYFAYPEGAYTAKICRLVKQAGYSAAFSVNFGRATKNSNLYALERIPIFKSKFSFLNFYLRLKFTPVVEKLKQIKYFFVPAPAPAL
jgi:peptidoglycan/xylan/chitin deacetylase (PgdA/CDA1 family)